MNPGEFDLAAAASREMQHEGFDPDFTPAAREQAARLRQQPIEAPDSHLKDLRHILWSSIDNDTSRDLDQIEFAERVVGGIRVLVGIADVSASVPAGSPIDQHAAAQTTTVYTPVRTFPMLPEELSTDLTSLGEGQGRRALTIEFLVAADGSISNSDIYAALVDNCAKLTYNGVGPWLEQRAAPPARVADSVELQQQLKLQDEAARALREQRHRLGALEFDRVEAVPVIKDGRVTGILAQKKTRANDLIEDFMVAANQVMAERLRSAGCCALQRVVKQPERWSRIVDLAAARGTTLPAEPDSAALAAFLRQEKAQNAVHYADLSLAVVKLMGSGEYAVVCPDEQAGHFGLAAHDYTHSTAPNRRFADLVTQRLIKSVLGKESQPYTLPELQTIASNCTLKENAARKVERTMAKCMAAVALAGHVGQSFSGVVTGVTPKGTFVRIFDPPAEGRIVQGEKGVDVGDVIRVRLVGTNPDKGWIDFSRS